MCGVYPAQDVADAGDQVSSADEGRVLTFLESELFHPYHADGFVDKGDPVVAQTSTGFIVGIAKGSALAATDLIAVDTEGIWALMVYADTDDVWLTSQVGTITPGDQLFINRVTTGAITAGVGACGISKRRDHATQVPFGVALGSMTDGDEGVIPVKVHNQPSFDLVSGMCNRNVATTDAGFSYFARMTAGQSEGLAGYVDGTVLGVVAGAVYNFGTWLAIDSAATMGANVGTPLDTGIYSGAAQAACTLYFAGQHHAQLFGAPAALYAWRLSSTQTITALIAAANAGSVGYAADATEDATKLGAIPLFVLGGVTHYVRTYADGS